MKVILWDWDNTLADTIEPLRHAFNETFKDYHMLEITRAQMKVFMNHAGSRLFLDLFPNCDQEEVRQVYLKHYMEHVFELSLMPGAQEILKWTKDKGFINLAASNKHHFLLKKEVEEAGLKGYFSGVFGAEQFSENKPSKVFTDGVLANLSDIKQLFSVGDGVSDIKMAHNYPNGKAILVGTDPSAAEFEDNLPDYFAQNLMEVRKYLDE